MLWVGGTFFFAALINYTLNARSVLPLIPAVGILLARRFDRVPVAQHGATPAKIAAALALSAWVSLWVVRADTELANSARRAAEIIYERTRGQGSALWFEGHWGFQYYMELRGAHPVDLNDPSAQPGDFVVIPVNNIQLAEIAPQFIASSQSLTLPVRCGASTICRNLGGGFYSSYWGPLPYVFGPIPPERYVIVRLAPEQ